MKPAQKTFGIRSVRNYKLYAKSGCYFASYKDAARLRRVKLANKAAAEQIAAYYEVRHGTQR